MKHLKKITSLFIVLVMCVSAFSALTITSSATTPTATAGWGAENDGIFYIDDVNDFLAFAAQASAQSDYAGKTVKLRGDVDLTGVVPSGTSYNASDYRYYLQCFRGTFDGCGYSIINFTNNTNAKDNNVALFRFLQGSPTIKNLSVHGTLTKVGNNNGFAGIACQTVTDGTGTVTFDNVYVDVDISLSSTASHEAKTGGMIGYLANNGGIVNFTNCVVASTISETATSDYPKQVGGFVGYAGTGTTVTFDNCAFIGNMGDKLGAEQGAFVGRVAGNISLKRSLHIGNSRDSSANTISYLFYLDRAATGETATYTVTVEDTYTVKKNSRTSGSYAIGAHNARSYGFNVSIEYNGTSVHSKNYSSSEQVYTDIVTINTVVKTMAVAENVTYTDKTFAEKCPALKNDWVVILGETTSFGSNTITKILPRTVALMTETTPVAAEYVQIRDNGDTYDVRFVSTVNFEDLKSYAFVGFEYTVKVAGADTAFLSSEKKTTKVFSSIVANNETVLAETYGADAFNVIEFTGFAENSTSYEITVLAFAEKEDGTRTYDYNGALTVTVNNSALEN